MQSGLGALPLVKEFTKLVRRALGGIQGAASIGFGYAVQYLPGTVGWALKQHGIPVGWFPGATDTDKVNAAIAFAMASSGSKRLKFDRMYNCPLGWNQVTAASGLIFEGGAPSHNGSTPTCGVNFTTGGTGTLISMVSCENIHFVDMRIDYSNGAFTGKVIKLFNHARTKFERCSINGNGVTSAGVLLDLDEAIGVTVSDSSLSGAQYLISGQRADTTGFSNGIGLIGNNYDRYTVAAVRNPGQGWDMRDRFVENRADGTGKYITCDVGIQVMGLNVEGAWLGDASSAALFSWIDISGGTGVTIKGLYCNGTGNLNSYAVAFTGATVGVVIKGNRFSSHLAGVVGVEFLDEFDISCNSYAGSAGDVAGEPVAGASGVIQRNGRLKFYGGVAWSQSNVTYGPSMTPDATSANSFEINATNGTAFTINDPTGVAQGQIYTVRIRNLSGGALGAVTWGPNYRMETFAAPANGTNITFQFEYNGAISYQVGKAVQIAN